MHGTLIPGLRCCALATLLTVCGATAGAEKEEGKADAGGLAVSGDFKWGKKSGTLSGTLTENGTAGSYAIKLVPKWGRKDRTGYDGTVSIDDKGKVTGTIKHTKQGTYTLTGSFAKDTMTCQYQGKKSKKDNPVTITITRPARDDS